MTEVSEGLKVRRPLLGFGPLTGPIWEAARERRLVLQRCLGCERIHHPPVRLCPDCHGEEFDYRPVAGTGTVYSFSIMREPRVVGFEALVPYACMAVQIDEQPGVFLIGNLVGAPVEAVRVGLRVQVCFEPYGIDDLLLPQWTPADGSTNRDGV
jgi:uncharacterized protein